MRTMKKSLALTLALTMVLSLFAGITVFAADTAITEVEITATGIDAPAVGEDVLADVSGADADNNAVGYAATTKPAATTTIVTSAKWTGATGKWEKDKEPVLTVVVTATGDFEFKGIDKAKVTLKGLDGGTVDSVSGDAKVLTVKITYPKLVAFSSDMFSDDISEAKTTGFMKNTLKGGTITFPAKFQSYAKNTTIAIILAGEKTSAKVDDFTKTAILGTAKFDATKDKAVVLKTKKGAIKGDGEKIFAAISIDNGKNYTAVVGPISFPAIRVPGSEDEYEDGDSAFYYKDAYAVVVNNLQPEDKVSIWGKNFDETGVKTGAALPAVDKDKGFRYDPKGSVKPIATIKVKKSLKYKAAFGLTAAGSEEPIGGAIVSTKLAGQNHVWISVQGKDQYESAAVKLEGITNREEAGVAVTITAAAPSAAAAPLKSTTIKYSLTSADDAKTGNVYSGVKGIVIPVDATVYFYVLVVDKDDDEFGAAVSYKALAADLEGGKVLTIGAGDYTKL